jgi:hypothetical protein
MEAERRQVTVLFTDMVGFATFSERSGEESALTLMQSLSKLVSRLESFRALPATASQNFLGFVQLACLIILFRRF